MKKELIQKQSLIYHSEVMSEINSIADMNTSVNRGKYGSENVTVGLGPPCNLVSTYYYLS